MTTASAEATNDNQKWLYRLVHLTIFSTTAYLTYLADPGSSLFSWHPFLMGLAILFFTNEAFLLFSPQGTLLPRFLNKRWIIIELHSYMSVAAVVSICIGFLAIYNNKEENGKPHFVSWHGLIGLAITILAVIQLLFGPVAKYAKFMPSIVPVNQIKTIHIFLGVLASILGVFALVTSCATNFFSSQHSVTVKYLFMALFALLNGFVALRTALSTPRVSKLFKSH